jgi:hypothetical protein
VSISLKRHSQTPSGEVGRIMSRITLILSLWLNINSLWSIRSGFLFVEREKCELRKGNGLKMHWSSTT